MAMVVALCSTAVVSSSSSLYSGRSGRAWNLYSRPHISYTDLAMNLWPSKNAIYAPSKLSKSLRCRCQSQGLGEDTEQNRASLHEDTDEWKLWQEYFSKIEEEENLLLTLKFQLEEAVKSEDFQQAAKLKKAIEAARGNDVISIVNKELQRALEEERYDEAAQLRDEAGAGLVGWWAGVSKDENDPFGRIINVKAAHGRFVAQLYNGRQLAVAFMGDAKKTDPQKSPLFEVFVKKHDKGFSKQVVYLQSEKQAPEFDLKKLIDQENNKATRDPMDQAQKLPESQIDQGPKSAEDQAAPEKEDGKSDSLAQAYKDATDIVEFMKTKIPNFKGRVVKVIAPEGVPNDIPKLFEDIIRKEQQNKPDDPLRKDQQDKPEGDSTIEEIPPDAVIKLVIGGASPLQSVQASPGSIIRVPAFIVQETKDRFVLQIDSIEERSKIPMKASSEKLPADLINSLWDVEKVPLPEVPEPKEALKLAWSRSSVMSDITRTTIFHRIDVTESADPFTGLYIGGFGANSPEILQLKRKYGDWDTQRTSPEDKLQFYEYVEAVKLIGDWNVPAGQVSFRARIGKEFKLSGDSFYPDELGVIARYKGQGRLAETGFKNPKWCDGELILLDGKKAGPAGGAKLGLSFFLPDQRFIVLFDRLKIGQI